MNLIIEAKENSTGIDIVYLDIIKAFNTVSNNELLLKLYNMVVGNLWQVMAVAQGLFTA